MPSKALLEAVAVTAELTGTDLSAAAARVMADDLAVYPEAQVLAALVRCRRELRARLTIADIVARLDDGRPGPEEAWAICYPAIGDEGATIVWSDEMREAMQAALSLADDKVAARMAFLECYRAACTEARNRGAPVRWSASLGWRSADREGPLLAAVEAGRLAIEHVRPLLAPENAPQKLLDMTQRALAKRRST